MGRATPGASARARGGRRRATRRTSSPPGASSSSGSPSSRRRSSCSRTCSGRTPGCSTSSSTCSSGRAASRSSSSSSRGPSSPRSGRPGALAGAASPRSTSSRSRRRRWTSCSPGSCQGCRTSCARASSSAPRGFRSTPSRRCECCSTGACSSGTASVYRPIGPIETLEVPETLHALIAARLDGLTTDERRLLQDAAVLGKVFTKQGLTRRHAAGRGRARAAARRARPQGDALDPGRSALAGARPVRLPSGPRQARGLRDDLEARAQGEAPGGGGLSPVAVERRGGRERSRSWPRITSMRTRPRPTIRTPRRFARRRGTMLVRAAERAASLAANAEAQRAYERAIELTDEPLDAGGAARARRGSGGDRSARGRCERALRAFDRALRGGRRRRTRRRGFRPDSRRSSGTGGGSRTGLRAWSARWRCSWRRSPTRTLQRSPRRSEGSGFFAGDRELASQRIETALGLAEALSLPEVLSQALNTKAILLISQGRRDEGSVLLRHALEVALEHDKPSAALRAFYNLADECSCQGDRYEESAEMVRRGLATPARSATVTGSGRSSASAIPSTPSAPGTKCSRCATSCHTRTGPRLESHTAPFSARPFRSASTGAGSTRRGGCWSAVAEFERSADVQERCYYGFAKAQILLAEGDRREALRVAESVFAERESMSVTVDAVKEAFALAVQAALELDRLDKAEELLAIVERLAPGLRPQFLNAQLARFRAQFAARRGKADDADHLFRGAGGLFQRACNSLPSGQHATRIRPMARRAAAP